MDWHLRLLISALFSLLVASASFVAADEPFPNELVNFVASQSNPLFAGTGEDTWDRKIRERGWILREGARWHLWYTGYKGERSDTKFLGYATSPDGIRWTRHTDNPVFAENWVEDMHVVKHNDTYYMVAEGRNDIAHMLTSKDGVRWQNYGRLNIRYTDGRPLSEGPYGTPTLWIEDGTWYLFYERRDSGVWLARSTDRKVWTNVQDDPVIARGPNTYDQRAVALNQVIKIRDSYYAIYHANADPEWQGPWTTNIAVSKDLIHWTKYQDNPIIRGNFSSGQLVHDGQRFRLYTAHPDLRVYFSAPRDNAAHRVSRGMQRFRANDIAGSIRDFDRAAELDEAVVPRLWQRGISLYYAARFDEGRRQFEIHKTVNPHDVENATWHFICVARAEDLDAARAAIIEIDTAQDTRVPLAEVYNFYAGRGTAAAVLKAANTANTERARMYAHLYLGLYYEVAGDAEKAERHMRESAAAKLRNHYMHDVARIHLRQRGWKD